jgi:hypothetical protein
MGPMVGGLASQLKLTSELIRQEKASSGDDLKTAVGGLKVLVNRARILAYEAGAMLDNPPHEEFLSRIQKIGGPHQGPPWFYHDLFRGFHPRLMLGRPSGAP